MLLNEIDLQENNYVGCQIESSKQITLRTIASLPQKNGAERPYYKLNRKVVCQCDSSRIPLANDVTMRNEHGNDRKLCKQSSAISLTLIINDMKRFFSKISKSKKPSLGSIHVHGQVTSISTLLTSTDLMPSIPASDATASAQVTAGVSRVSVSVQFRSSHLLSIDLLLSNRPLIISESLLRFPLWRSVIFLL